MTCFLKQVTCIMKQVLSLLEFLYFVMFLALKNIIIYILDHVSVSSNKKVTLFLQFLLKKWDMAIASNLTIACFDQKFAYLFI